MCGIAGYWSAAGSANTLQVTRMAERIAHRGPDGAGAWVDERCEVALAHRRLAILDLSKAGHQPMQSASERYVLTFNGEIYNHLELRGEMEANNSDLKWRGHSDTETLLAAIEYWGMPAALGHLNGMFAFALWDRRERTLTLARDRLGEKPLYYGHHGEFFLFASELKAFDALPQWTPTIDRSALAAYLRFNYVPAPLSIFAGIAKLPPATYVIASSQGRRVSEPTRYWDLDEVARSGIRARDTNTTDVVDRLETLLRDAVGKRMAADVPLGAFLSGGYDSSLVVALMQSQSTRPVKTFTIGFSEKEYNEAGHAKAVAQHLGTEHTELYVSADDALAIVPRLPAVWDEPFADSSQIPTLLLSQLTRRHVTVSLSGDGGDELFCGYNRYTAGYRVWSKLNLLPRTVRDGLALGMRHFPNSLATHIGNRLPGVLRTQHLGDRLPKLADVIAVRDSQEYYRRLVSQFKTPTDVVLGATERPLTSWSTSWSAASDIIDQDLSPRRHSNKGGSGEHGGQP
jgi:asparagine synthase (glutamine-hydrolysing)